MSDDWRKLVASVALCLCASVCSQEGWSEVAVASEFASRTKLKDVVLEPLGRGVQVTAGATAKWPGVHLLPADGRSWDFSRNTHIQVPVRNLGSVPLRLHLRIDDAAGSATTKINVAPGEWAELLAPLISRGPFEITGMQALPQGLATAGIDTSAVTQLIVFFAREPHTQIVEIGTVSAVGDRVVHAIPDDPFPLVDEFGQFRHRQWPGKAHTRDDLNKAETLPKAPVRDVTTYGGLRIPLRASGRFRTEKLGERWWLVDPEGGLFWSHGVNVVRDVGETKVEGRAHYFPNEVAHAAKHDVVAANLQRKWGDQWPNLSAEQTFRRLQSWGLNTLGLWSQRSYTQAQRVPYVDWLYYETSKIPGTRMVDMWSTEFEKALQRAATRSRTRLNDPWMLGVFVDNELAWADAQTFVQRVVASGAGSPAKRAFVDLLKRNYKSISGLNRAWRKSFESWQSLAADRKVRVPAVDAKAFYVASAHRYYGTVQKVVRGQSSDVLYLCSRFNGRFLEVERVAADYCDVLSFNLYRHSLEGFEPLHDLPVLVTEFHFGALDRGPLGAGLVAVASQAERGEAYLRYGEQAAKHPNIVGMHWFQYRDEPTLGRALDGENFQIGLVDIIDQPYQETVEAVRAVALKLYEWREAHMATR